MPTTGIEAFLEVLAGAGVKHVFGNPGTTELPLNDALAKDRRFEYILGLHEVPVVAMADGYAMASGSVGVANVHISCGLGNAMGMLYNAHREGSPLLLTAGQQDRRLLFEEPVLASDLAAVARPWAKWSCEVRRVEDVPSAVRRAVQTALTPPTGPVFLALPIDLQTEEADGLDLSPPHVPDRRLRPPEEALRRAAEVLAQAKDPLILAGSRVTEAGAVAELVAVAERLGAPVLADAPTNHGRLPFPPRHPLYAGQLPLWSPDVRDRLAGHDVLLVAGQNLLCDYICQEPARPIDASVRIVQMDCDPWQVGKNYPVAVGVLGDLKCGLEELRRLLEGMPPDREAVRARAERHAREHRAANDALRAKAVGQAGRRPMTPPAFVAALAAAVPPEVVVIDEAITSTGTGTYLERLGAVTDPYGYFSHRGWALGWGLGCALGVKLAWPDRPVLALLGDGAAMYGIQGLWTAAHHRIPVTFVVSNNAQYKILKDCGHVLRLPQMEAGNYLAMDLTDPAIDFVGLSRSLGVEAVRVTEPDELTEEVRRSLGGDRPRLIEAVVGG
ncbi:MAG TPA: thiamine pyrophosphate-binding protein [Gemmataceae bacterium]